MPRISTDNYDTVAAWNGTQDLFVVEQTDGTKVATPEQIKQYVLGDMDEVPTQNSNNPVKSGGIFSTMAVPKYDATNRREYYEGGSAFSGNIDSSPTAGSNNAVASGGTKTYVDNAINTALDNSKIATLAQYFRNVNITSAWGSLYISDLLTFDTSSLGLQSAPKSVSLAVMARGATVMTIIDAVNTGNIKFYIARPNSASDVTVYISALIVY